MTIQRFQHMVNSKKMISKSWKKYAHVMEKIIVHVMENKKFWKSDKPWEPVKFQSLS